MIEVFRDVDDVVADDVVGLEEAPANPKRKVHIAAGGYGSKTVRNRWIASRT